MKSVTVASTLAIVALPLLSGCAVRQSEESEPEPEDTESVTSDSPLTAVTTPGNTINYSARFRSDANGYGSPYEIRWRYPGGAWNSGDWQPTSPKSLVGIRGAHPTTYFRVPQMEVFNDSNKSAHTGTYYLHWSCVDANGTRKGWQITRNFSLAPSFSYYSYTLTCPSNSGTVYYVEGTLTVD